MNYAFHFEAEAEFKHAIDYYESCAEGLGYDFAVEMLFNYQANRCLSESLGDFGRRSQEMPDKKIPIWSSVHRRA